MVHLALILGFMWCQPVQSLISPATNLTHKLRCYHCNSEGERNCSLPEDEDVRLCGADESFCKVSRVDYLITDQSQSEEFSQWSIERSCAKSCNNFCVTMGARTKITYCTSCCKEDGCNVGNGTPDLVKVANGFLFFFLSAYCIVISQISSPLLHT